MLLKEYMVVRISCCVVVSASGVLMIVWVHDSVGARHVPGVFSCPLQTLQSRPLLKFREIDVCCCLLETRASLLRSHAAESRMPSLGLRAGRHTSTTLNGKLDDTAFPTDGTSPSHSLSTPVLCCSCDGLCMLCSQLLCSWA